MAKPIRKKLAAALICSAIILGCSFFRSVPVQEEVPTNYNYINNHTGRLISILDKSLVLADSALTPAKHKQLKALYFNARNHYKHIEFFIEYCAPFDVKYFINGALVKKSEPEIGKRIVDPHGFQVIEEQLFGNEPTDQKLLLTELQLLRTAFTTFQHKLPDIRVSDSQLLEMMQFEIVRISSLSLSGADATYTQTNITECSYALNGIKEMLEQIKKKYPVTTYPAANHQKLIVSLTSAENYCSLHTDYLKFDRLYFITRYLKPSYKLLVRLHTSSLFPFTPVTYALNLNSEQLFEKESYNLNYFSVKATDTIGNALQAKLGEFLFFDPVLSSNNQRACASCHKPDLAFSDGLQKGPGFASEKLLDRNTPSLLNTIFQKHFFYDGRARQLEQQANDVLHNQKEMNSSIEDMISKLNQSEEYRSLFKNSYRGTIDTTISYYGILKAITEYEKTLVSMNSRFDKYLKGDYRQLTAQETHGYNLFSGKALCGSCHFFPLFNGLVPPVYNDTEYEVIGVPENAAGKTIDKDEGRMLVSTMSIHQYAFKTPTVRNSHLTAPYMHNGVYKTLDEVLDFYNKGGGQGIGITIPHQTLPFDSLQLSQKEMMDIKAFMLSLTDTTGLTKKPKQLPVFKDPILNRRVIGGVY